MMSKQDVKKKTLRRTFHSWNFSNLRYGTDPLLWYICVRKLTRFTENASSRLSFYKIPYWRVH